MQKRFLALSAAAIAVAGGVAVAQQTMQGMDHSNIGGMAMGGMGQMGRMNDAMMIPPELAENPAVQA